MINQTEDSRNSYDAPCMPDISGLQENGFNIIMELTREEKQELLKIWRAYVSNKKKSAC